MKKNTKKSKVPFFVNLLTVQEMQNTAAGSIATSRTKDITYQTLKYPSDGDDDIYVKKPQ